MKKIIIYLVLIFVISYLILVPLLNKKDNKGYKTINVAEVTHSIFYAPWYVALENNYFEEENIKINLILTPGADKVTASVLSKDVDVGFCGPEATIYIYNGEEKDYIQTFAGLTKRDGQFIVSRVKDNNFDYNKLIGKEVLAGRKGGMPELNFENGLRNINININDVKINSSIEFASLVGAFIGGTGDYVNLFEPNALKLEKEGLGYVVGSIGQISGEMPYTAFNARKSYIENNKDTLIKFTKALKKGLDFVNNNTDETVAQVIYKQFPDLSLDDITTIVKRYREADSWLETPYISKDLFNNLQKIIIDSKITDDYAPYEDLINNLYDI